MIDGLISGKLHGQPQRRNDSRGQPFAVGKLRAAAGNGDGVFVSWIAFGDAALQLLGLGDGDSVAMAGSLTPKAWTDKEGQARPALDMQVQQVLSAYHLTKKRRQVHGGDEGRPHEGGRNAATPDQWGGTDLMQEGDRPHEQGRFRQG